MIFGPLIKSASCVPTLTNRAYKGLQKYGDSPARYTRIYLFIFIFILIHTPIRRVSIYLAADSFRMNCSGISLSDYATDITRCIIVSPPRNATHAHYYRLDVCVRICVNNVCVCMCISVDECHFTLLSFPILNVDTRMREQWRRVCESDGEGCSGFLCVVWIRKMDLNAGIQVGRFNDIELMYCEMLCNVKVYSNGSTMVQYYEEYWF